MVHVFICSKWCEFGICNNFGLHQTVLCLEVQVDMCKEKKKDCALSSPELVQCFKVKEAIFFEMHYF